MSDRKPVDKVHRSPLPIRSPSISHALERLNTVATMPYGLRLNSYAHSHSRHVLRGVPRRPLRGRGGLEDRAYTEQWHSIMSCGFGTADAYSFYLQLLGHDAHEVILNCLPLQRSWAAEHGVGIRRPRIGDRRRAVVKIMSAQVAEFEPDVIYVQDLKALAIEDLKALRKSARLLVGQLGTEPPDVSRLQAFDLITTSFPHFVPWLRGIGVDSELLESALILGHSTASRPALAKEWCLWVPSCGHAGSRQSIALPTPLRKSKSTSTAMVQRPGPEAALCGGDTAE